MKRLFLMVFYCQLGLGQAVYSGPASDSGAAIYGVWGSCAAPNFCAYAGVDVIPWGTVPNLGGLTNNNATVYDTSYLGHTNRDGTLFNNSSLLSPVYRTTDINSGAGVTQFYTSGLGGAGSSPGLTNSDTTLVIVSGGSARYVARFNPTGANKGLPCSSLHTLPALCTTWFSNTGTAYPPDNSPIIFLTAAQDANGSCSSNCALTGFGSPQFDRNNRNLGYSFGMTSLLTGFTPFYIAQDTGKYWFGTPVVDFKYGMPTYQASNWQTSTNYYYGQYVIHPLNRATEMATGGYWCSSTTTPSCSGGHIYALGDVVTDPTGTCMYKVTVASGTSTGSGVAPAFKTSNCTADVKTDGAGNTWQDTFSTAQFLYQETNPNCTVGSPCTSAVSAFQWLATPNPSLCTTGAMTAGAFTLSCGTSVFTASMVGQTISVAGAWNSGTTLYTTIKAYTSGTSVTLATAAATTVSAAAVGLTGHPDMLSQSAGDANGLVWTNIEPAFVPSNASSWSEKGDVSIDALGSVTITGAPGGPTFPAASKFGSAFSMQTYGLQPVGGISFANWNGSQNSGTDLFVYDSVINAYHHVNTVTGTWEKYTCNGGTGYACTGSGSTWDFSVVGTFKIITDPLGTGQPCPLSTHGLNLSKNGHYATIGDGGYMYQGPCNDPVSGMTNSRMWNIAAAFNEYASMQTPSHGLNHATIGAENLYAWSASGYSSTAGVFMGVYPNSNVSGTNGNPVVSSVTPPFSVYLPAFPDHTYTQTSPPGCYVTDSSGIKSPDCNLSEWADSHVSRASDPGTDTWPVCGTTYNYATLNPYPFNTWQGMETCYQGYPTYSSLPSCTLGVNCQNYGLTWQFTHSFATGTNSNFATQFQISQLSQDGNWMFWGSEWGCAVGSNLASNAAPAVWTSGTYYQQLLQTATSSTAAPVYLPITSVCGVPWLPSSSYTAGNLINPIEGTTGGGSIDDVFQAQNSGTSGCAPNSGRTGCGTGGKQPTCKNYANAAVSCFAITNPPTITPVTPSGVTEVGTTSTYTFAGASLTLNVGGKVTLAGWTPSGYNGTWAVTGTVGVNCPGSTCGSLSTWQLTGLAASLGTPSAFGTATAQGDQVCDSPSDTGIGNANGINACQGSYTGIFWADLGPQDQRGDVFAVNLGNQR
jgi:hypothetical protein